MASQLPPELAALLAASGQEQVERAWAAFVAHHSRLLLHAARSLGADYDGNSLWPEGLEDVSAYPNLFAELIRRGWSDEDLKLLAGENLLRAMAKAEAVSRAMMQE